MKIGDKIKVNNDYKEFDENGKYTFSHCCGEIGIVKNIKNETRGEMVYIERVNIHRLRYENGVYLLLPIVRFKLKY